MVDYLYAIRCNNKWLGAGWIWRKESNQRYLALSFEAAITRAEKAFRMYDGLSAEQMQILRAEQADGKRPYFKPFTDLKRGNPNDAH